jgi:putative peptidoglycan lipid II flippase
MSLDPKPETRNPKPETFLSHARLIGAITFVSRIVGLAREMVGTYFFGASAVWAAWKVAFTIPNLFRKLFGEGALSAAFIPLYAQAVQAQRNASDAPREPAGDFAAASVNLLVAILLALTAIGEVVLWAVALLVPLRPDHLLTVQLAMIMLPYVLLVCGAAFLSAILQVHERFAASAATAIVLNVCLIAAIGLCAREFDLRTDAGQDAAVFWLSWAVLVSGVVQVAMLLPSLHAAGFRFRIAVSVWTPAVKRMLRLTGPVAFGASVLQLGVLIDKGVALALAEAPGQAHSRLLGGIRLPMAEGAAARLDLAQYMYQFPLGVFAIALATAIFPKLSQSAVARDGALLVPDSPTEPVPPGPVPRQDEPHRRPASGAHRVAATEEFKSVLRRGVEASLFIGLPASAGMALVAWPAARLLFQQGKFTAEDAHWVALSTAIYSCAIWAFSLLQIVNRAFYALHDATTPLKWVAINLAINFVVELPLIWTPLRESGMAVGTLVSFTVQAFFMLWTLSRRSGGLGLRQITPAVGKMLLATLVMTGACLAVMYSPVYPAAGGKPAWAMQLGIIMSTGGLTYFLSCLLLGLDVRVIMRRRPTQEPR